MNTTSSVRFLSQNFEIKLNLAIHFRHYSVEGDVPVSVHLPTGRACRNDVDDHHW